MQINLETWGYNTIWLNKWLDYVKQKSNEMRVDLKIKELVKLHNLLLLPDKMNVFQYKTLDGFSYLLIAMYLRLSEFEIC